MALPKKQKKVIPDIGAAVQKAAGQEQTKPGGIPEKKTTPIIVKKTGRPSPRTGKVERMTLLLSENTAERLTIAFATEQIKRKKDGEKVDKSLLIEEMIIKWLDENKL